MPDMAWNLKRDALIRIAHVIAQEFPESNVVAVAKALAPDDLNGAETAGELLSRVIWKID